jgi:hypothetical protein
MQGQQKIKIILPITRKCCEKCDLSTPLNILEGLIKKPFAMRSTVHITFDGYNDDSRELYDVPEVVNYYKKLNEAFPALLLFIDYAHGEDLPTFNFAMHLMLLLAGQYTTQKVNGTIVSNISRPQISTLIMQTWPHIENLFPPTIEGNSQYTIVDQEISAIIRKYIHINN